MSSQKSLTATELRTLGRLLNVRKKLTNELAAIDARVAAMCEGRKLTGLKSKTGINSLGHPSLPSLSPKAGSKHGALKSAILKTLKKAGKRGRTIRDLAEDVGVLKANIHVWFSTTGKRVEGLEKIGEARWRYTG